MKTQTSKKPVILVCVFAVLLSIVAVLFAHQVWFSKQQKFQNVTVELGTDTLGISQFMTKYALPHRVGFVSDVSAIDLGKVGTTELILSHGPKVEKVTLTVEDTTAPEATFQEKLVKLIDYVPNAQDFIREATDLSELTFYFVEEPVVSGEYEEVPVNVVVEDAYGNKTIGSSILSYVWIKDAFTLEYGQQLTKADLVLDAEKDGHLVNQEDIDAINASPLGTYTIVSSTATRTLECVVTVQDTTGPVLELKEVQVYLNGSAKLDDFLVSATDPSGVKEVRLVSEMTFDTMGEQKVIIEAEDIYGNISQYETSLFVTTDTTPPSINGLTNMTVAKHSDPKKIDFLSGVSATDAKDGACAVQYSTSKVDFDKAGTYYVTYTAKDKSGNVATARRKITVEHDQEDTNALIASMAASWGNMGITGLRDKVRSYIGYNTNWGGDDPVWYGFKNKVGNCYVHALCLKALYDYFGIPNQIIHVKDHSHYWLLVYTSSGWKHIDPTPSSLHGRYYEPMNDAQRYETLSGRDWDRDAWPACP